MLRVLILLALGTACAPMPTRIDGASPAAAPDEHDEHEARADPGAHDVPSDPVPTPTLAADGTAAPRPSDPIRPSAPGEMEAPPRATPVTMPPSAAPPGRPPRLHFDLRHATRDAGMARIVEGHLLHAREQLRAFFGELPAAVITVTVHPDRAAFDASFPPEWGVTRTACWMVATGVACRLDLLSPRAWPTEACEHDPTDAQHVARLLTHELTHVVHGERNPTGDFVGAEAVGWFAEGLAVYASGQLDGSHAGDARRALAAGAGPTALQTAWSGTWRYGVCGSLVRYIDRRLGREGLIALLAATDNATLLAALDTDEATLLADWRRSVLGGPP